MGLQERAIRSDLFEKRLAHYEFVKETIKQVRNKPKALDIAAVVEFNRAIDEAQFLFSRQVSADLKAIYKDMGKLNAINEQISAEFAANGHAGVKLPQQKLELGRTLTEHLDNLPNIYREMRLSE